MNQSFSLLRDESGKYSSTRLMALFFFLLVVSIVLFGCVGAIMGNSSITGYSIEVLKWATAGSSISTVIAQVKSVVVQTGREPSTNKPEQPDEPYVSTANADQEKKEG